MQRKKAIVLSALMLSTAMMCGTMSAQACEGHKGKKAPAPTSPAPAPETPSS